jgi:hypothetical protein
VMIALFAMRRVVTNGALVFEQLFRLLQGIVAQLNLLLDEAAHAQNM